MPTQTQKKKAEREAALKQAAEEEAAALKGGDEDDGEEEAEDDESDEGQDGKQIVEELEAPAVAGSPTGKNHSPLRKKRRRAPAGMSPSLQALIAAEVGAAVAKATAVPQTQVPQPIPPPVLGGVPSLSLAASAAASSSAAATAAGPAGQTGGVTPELLVAAARLLGEMNGGSSVSSSGGLGNQGPPPLASDPAPAPSTNPALDPARWKEMDFGTREAAVGAFQSFFASLDPPGNTRRTPAAAAAQAEARARFREVGFMVRRSGMWTSLEEAICDWEHLARLKVGRLAALQEGMATGNWAAAQKIEDRMCGQTELPDFLRDGLRAGEGIRKPQV